MKLSSALLVVLLAAFSSQLRADSFNISYLGSGVQTSSSSTYVETFNTATKNGAGTYTTTFGGSGITGTYSGAYSLIGANAYGGANGTGSYISTSTAGQPYTLALSSSVNFFGLWFSALDSGNVLQFYSGDALLLTFSSADFIKAVGACPGSAYCGNPNSGLDASEQFAFINFYDTGGTFNKIVFSQAAGSGGQFESDNHTLGNLTATPGGSALVVTPEPSSLLLLGTSLVLFAVAMRVRLALRV